MVECRRCPALVVDIANRLIAHNPNPHRTALTYARRKRRGRDRCLRRSGSGGGVHRRADGEAVAAGVPPREIILLVPYNRVARPIRKALAARGIPVLSYDDEAEHDTPMARRRFALLKLLLDRGDRVALRWLIGEARAISAPPPINASVPIARRQERARGRPSSGSRRARCKLPRVGVLVRAFEQVKDKLDALEPKRGDLPALIDALFPDGEAGVTELRGSRREVATTATDASELRDLMIEAIIRPDVPEFIDEVRIMKLAQSKGLSSPVVFIAGCMQGVIPRLPRNVGAAARALAEARRLFYVGITRVKAATSHAARWCSLGRRQCRRAAALWWRSRAANS